MTTSLQHSASARKVSSFAAPTLAEVCSGRNNNLNLLRVLAAVGVLYAHAYGIPELANDDPIYRALGLSLGDLGVDVFFFVSGLLITKSFANKTLTEFAWARFVRIFPALWVSSLAFVVVAGLFFSPLSAREFWSRPETLTYLLRNSTMLPGLGAQQALPFALDTHVAEFNQPLWTLPHELQMYMLLGVLGGLGGLRSVWPAAGVLLIGLAGVAANKLFGVEPIALDRARFLYFFFAGSLVFLLRKHVVLKTSWFCGAIALVAVVLMATPSFAWRQAALLAVLPYLVLWLAFIPGGRVREYNRLGDYSYGMYIYAYPVQVYLFSAGWTHTPIANLGLALALTLPLAVLSWHLLERWALRLPAPEFLVRLTTALVPSRFR
jgi:peptidoglycan/LPS O-acetylase OafA/YrhL